MIAWLQDAALWTWQNSLAAAALAAAVLGMRRVFRRTVAPRWLCLAGWLVMLRLVLPAPLPNTWAWDRAWTSPAPKAGVDSTVHKMLVTRAAEPGGQSRGQLREDIAAARSAIDAMNAAGAGEQYSAEFAAAVEPENRGQAISIAPPGPVRLTDWLEVAAWVWSAGVVCCLGHALIRHGRFSRRLACTANAINLPWPGLVEECAAAVRLRSVPPLRSVPGSGTPYLCGLFHPRIIVPRQTLAVLTREEARHVLLHEMLHIARRDLAANWLIAAVRALHWFNPLIHLAGRRLLADRELLRDQQALSLLQGPADHSAYGHTLLKLALPLSAPAPSPGLAPLFHSEKELKRRLTMIQSPLKHQRLAAATVSVVLSALTAVLFTTARADDKVNDDPLSAASEDKAPAPAESNDQSRELLDHRARLESELKKASSPDDQQRLKVELATVDAQGKKLEQKVDEARRGESDASPVENLRALAVQMRERGQNAEAETIERAIKELTAADADPDGTVPGGEIMQLRAEMAEVKAAIAALRHEAGPDELANELNRLKLETLSGFGAKHPKVIEKKTRAAAIEKLMADRVDRKLADKIEASQPDKKPGKDSPTSDYFREADTAFRNALEAQNQAARAADQAALQNLQAALQTLSKLKTNMDSLDTPEKALRAEPVKETDPAGDNLPWGVAVPGKKGKVFTPYSPEPSVVDVEGFKKGDKVKCPYSGNFFRVP